MTATIDDIFRVANKILQGGSPESNKSRRHRVQVQEDSGHRIPAMATELLRTIGQLSSQGRPDFSRDPES
ncbi:MAG: hypothetical protein JO334_08655 [Verrucomicrobia bacterium]|nr:hypothetical protein [Verrucomicrobiota bacterium]